MALFKKHKAAVKAGEGSKSKMEATDKARPDGKPGVPAADPTPSAESRSPAAPLLDDDDEQFLERLVSPATDEEQGPPPPLPPRPKTPDLTWDDSDSIRLPTTAEGAAAAVPTSTPKPSRLSRLFHRSKTDASKSLTVPAATTADEAEREWADLSRVLARLDVTPAGSAAVADPPAAKQPSKARALALSASDEVRSLLAQFVRILKDVVAGAPTAVDDLAALLDGRNDAVQRGFERLPGSLQKLVTQVPGKVASALGPEVLAAAAEAQGLGRDGGRGKLLAPRSLGELVMTPAIVRSMLKAIVNALKVRWPAFVGTNVLWSTAVFLLLFVLWYCHKRGKEEREKREKGEADAGGGKVEAEGEATAEVTVVVDRPAESPRAS